VSLQEWPAAPAHLFTGVPGSGLLGPASDRFDKADILDRRTEDGQAVVQVASGA
jgi:hypothetical protein